MEEKLLTARIDDILRQSDQNAAPRFLGFLSESEAAICREYLQRKDCEIWFFGGYEDALRNFLCVAPKGYNKPTFPITPITFNYRKQDKLSHRDFLGSLMALGLTREKIGDILVEDGRCVTFAEKTAAKYALMEISKVGRVGVTLCAGADEPLPERSKKQEFTVTVASARLDCIVSAICSVSRNKALELIEKDAVSVNSFLSNKCTRKIENGDKISVRKNGRFDIVSVDTLSKKGRIILIYQKYI